MTYIQNHIGWIVVITIYLSGIAWLTYAYHQAPTEEQDPTDITIDDLIN